MDISDITIGWELEYKGLDTNEDFDFLWERFSSFGQIVEEGSFNCGFEIVSPVYSGADFLTNSVSTNLIKLFLALDKVRELKIDQDTGLHFHVGRENLSENTLEFLYDFCYSREGKNLLTKVGGRSLNIFCEPKKPDWASITLKEFSTRNTIINPWGLGGKTIEFRNPISTLKLPNFLAKAQLILALIEASDELFSLNVSNFLDFLSEREYNYTELTSLLGIVYEPYSPRR